MRRIGELRLAAERLHAITGGTRAIVQFTSHYELARRQLARVAGKNTPTLLIVNSTFRIATNLRGTPQLNETFKPELSPYSILPQPDNPWARSRRNSRAPRRGRMPE